MRTLLLADDNITVQRVIALTFAGEPIQVVAVGDGQQAMDKMSAHQPDIVLAGTTLPNGNGYDLARFMRSRAELKLVPVLLLAGAFEVVDEERLRSSGANGLLEKPVEPTTLISRVRELLGLQSEDTAAPMGRPAIASADNPVTAENSPEITDEMLDRIASKVADRLGAGGFGNALKQEMAATIRETVRNVVTEISERVIRDTSPMVVAETSERVIREAAPRAVAETAERLVRASAPAVIAETSERMVGGAVFGVVVEASERLIRDAVPTAVMETSERIIRDAVPAAVAAASERVARESMRSIVLETSERLVREEIERIKSRTT